MASLTLKITIPDGKVPQATAAFLARHPKPTEGPASSLSDKLWFQAWVQRVVNRELQLGKRQLDAPAPDTTDYFTP